MPKEAKLSRKWLPAKRLARSLRNVEKWLYEGLVCPICVETRHKWRVFESAQEIVEHCVEKHFTKKEQFLLYAFLNYTEKRVAEDDQVQEDMDDVLEERGKHDIRTSQCFCPFCLAVFDRYNPYASLRMFRRHFTSEHLKER